MTRSVALVVAAGQGTRMGDSLPKQYLAIGDRPLLWYSLDTLCRHPALHRTFVVLHPDDRLFATYAWDALADRLTPLYCGGATRAQSVLNGLERMQDDVDADDWVLVHDAARPCLTHTLIERLLQELNADPIGGLLAIPVADTLKREDAERRVLRTERRVLRTERREGLWQAQTPQMFRLGMLMQALRAADPAATTDEASAIEQLGYRPRLVMGSAANLKVTYPEDLDMARLLLQGNGE